MSNLDTNTEIELPMTDRNNFPQENGSFQSKLPRINTSSGLHTPVASFKRKEKSATCNNPLIKLKIVLNKLI